MMPEDFVLQSLTNICLPFSFAIPCEADALSQKPLFFVLSLLYCSSLKRLYKLEFKATSLRITHSLYVSHAYMEVLQKDHEK